MGGSEITLLIWHNIISNNTMPCHRDRLVIPDVNKK